jgi:hypothetical protein
VVVVARQGVLRIEVLVSATQAPHGSRATPCQLKLHLESPSCMRRAAFSPPSLACVSTMVRRLCHMLPHACRITDTARQAKASSKRIAASNAAAQRTLRAGFLVANAVHLLLVFGLRRRTRATKSAAAAYVGSEMLALGLWWTLVRMARDGDDLGQAGLTA